MIVPYLLALGALPLALSEVHQAPYERKSTPCTTKSVRKSWNDLTTTEKRDYLDADLCLMSSPPKTGLEGAKSRWDELQYTHAAQARYIHGVVRGFLAFPSILRDGSRPPVEKRVQLYWSSTLLG
ncbi:hypothetical protein ONZ43_g5751 [Nemania bipapillata]|uniref:Uncharacterized protein n=1 Tax=Nemania bipapillata TaxID=110536 RepID=A0ACC2I6V5_9PEZI|nr:hypothetical protein ONZ43_g5751 [Nemania bipapillata]